MDDRHQRSPRIRVEKLSAIKKEVALMPTKSNTQAKVKTKKKTKIKYVRDSIYRGDDISDLRILDQTLDKRSFNSSVLETSGILNISDVVKPPRALPKVRYFSENPNRWDHPINFELPHKTVFLKHEDKFWDNQKLLDFYRRTDPMRDIKL